MHDLDHPVLQGDHVQVSIIGLAAEVFICKHIAQETGGKYAVALAENHLEDCLLGLVAPPPTLDKTVQPSLVSFQSSGHMSNELCTISIAVVFESR